MEQTNQQPIPQPPVSQTPVPSAVPQQPVAQKPVPPVTPQKPIVLPPSNNRPMLSLIVVGFIMLLIGFTAGYLLGKTGVKSTTYNVAQTTYVTPTSIPVASPTVVPTKAVEPVSAWKPYSYPEFKYSFKMPNAYVITLNGPSPTAANILQLLNFAGTNYEVGSNTFVVSVQSAVSLDEGVKNTEKLSPLTNKQEAVVNNQPWVRYNIGTGTNEAIYLTYINNRLYTIDGTNEDLIKQVITTYQFAK